jgi:protein arginine kinase
MPTVHSPCVEDVVFDGEICYYRHPAGEPFAPESAIKIAVNWNSPAEIPSAFNKLVKKEAQISKKHRFAWNEEFGYLTPAVSWCGTALSFSCNVHLEGLHLLERLLPTLDALNATRIVHDSFSVDGITHAGHFFTLENSSSLGITDRDLCRRITSVLDNLVRQELNAREKLLKDRSAVLDDTIERALAILKNARLLSKVETLDLISPIRLAKTFGFIDGISLELLHKMMIDFFNMTIQEDEEQDNYAIDKILADNIRYMFKNVKMNSLGKKYLR